MGFTWFLLSLLAGYVSIRYNYFLNTRTLREAGYHLFFRSALWGIGWFIVSWIITYLFEKIPIVGPEVNLWWQRLSESPLSGTHAITLVLSSLSVWICNKVYRGKGREYHYKYRYRSFKEMNRTLDALLIERAQDKKPVAVTLDNDKVYIGVPLYPLETDERHETISLRLLFSGYRHKEDRSLKIQYSVIDILQKLQDDDVNEPDKITQVEIPLNKVVSVTHFDLDFHNETRMRSLV